MGGIIQNKCSGVKQEDVHCVHSVQSFEFNILNGKRYGFRPLNPGGKFATVGAGDGDLMVGNGQVEEALA